MRKPRRPLNDSRYKGNPPPGAGLEYPFCRLEVATHLNIEQHVYTMTPLAATACGSRLNTLTLTDLHSRLVVNSGSSHALLDLPSHGQESLLNIGSILG